MPKKGIHALKLEDISKMFAQDKPWYFVSSDGYFQTWQLDSDIPYRFTFQVCHFSQLSNGCTIADLVAAAVPDEHLAISVSF